MPAPRPRPYAAGARPVLAATVLVVGLLTACLAPAPRSVSGTTAAAASTPTGATGSSRSADPPPTTSATPPRASAAPSSHPPVVATTTTSPRTPATSPPAAVPSPSRAAGRVAAGQPAITAAYLPFPTGREAEMAAYSLRHYGSAQWQLHPTMIVLHYTAGSTWESARDTFAADVPNAGELPGTCAHYVIDRDGTIYALVPVTTRCRHTIGLNDRAIGIEMVQPATSDPRTADRDILARPAQRDAALALVRWLQATWAIPTSAVIGHAMANADPHFHDLTGLRNDHEDWQAADVATFRSLL